MSGTEAVKCPTCSGIQAVDVMAVRYRCTLCGSDWRWASCLGCTRLELSLEGQESWKCSRCSRYTRSWWRSTAAPEETHRIAGLRAQHRRGQLHARAQVPRRRRRRVAVAGTGAVMALLSVMAVVAWAGTPAAADHDRAACVAFAEARSTAANGGMKAKELEHALARLRTEAAQGSPAVASAVDDLLAAGRPGTATYLVAQTKVVQVCA